MILELIVCSEDICLLLRIDGDNFADKIHRDLIKSHDVFTDVNSIVVGEKWGSTIEDNISKWDIFIVIVTPAALESEYIEREILQDQRKNKKIIPCFY